MPDLRREKQGSSLNIDSQISKYFIKKLKGILQVVIKNV
ncbi:hypothetical protein Murru_1168 [Allomuricauda ruestringensis DSM 13258]|uniref:Uncharacterized protein n=1 Tax=Allomuricauda ruestringensis (strain DSM 13258 / CIP 107369 / LMG 19739 / B1) TaxID=886377 RepID=G2PN88_ALLRU|nr:hypothetical protein Murru_1168 [Allomuricauda ruestringensis DSM 13258]